MRSNQPETVTHNPNHNNPNWLMKDLTKSINKHALDRLNMHKHNKRNVIIEIFLSNLNIGQIPKNLI